MVFKKPGNSRDDRSGRSSNRNSKSDDRSKKPFTPSNGRSSNSNFNKPGDRPKKSLGAEPAGDRRSFSPPKGKPYTGRPSADDRPKRSFGSENTGDKKPYPPKSRAPYTGRPTTDDRPKRNFGGVAAGERKSYSPSRTPYSGRPATGGDKSFPAKPGFKSRESSSSNKFDTRPADGGFKKREGDFKDKPYRKPAGVQGGRPIHGKPEGRSETPARIMRGRKKTDEKEDTGLIRLNRYISNAGICSRRKADELISAGVVSVNGVVISELGHKVDPTKDVIRYNGETLKRERMVYVLLNKPKDYLTTTDDPQERRTVMQLVDKASKERIYPIGRLDRNTTGLLLMTNDGDLADKLSHPKNNVVKLYHVELNKSLTQGDLNKIQFGLELEDGLIKPDSVSYVSGATKKEIGIQIHSGKNRIVRRIFEHLGYDVAKLDRAVYAGLTKKDLPRGRWRFLTDEEVIQLKHLI